MLIFLILIHIKYTSNTLIKYCADNNNIMSDKSLLDSDSYTCVSSAWKTCSWLDHLLSTFDMHPF